MSLLCALCLLAACHRKPTPQAPIAAPPAKQQEKSWLAEFQPRAKPLPPESLTPEMAERRRAVIEKYGPPQTAAAASQQAAQLQQEYYATKEHYDRTEIIYRLADASNPQTRGVLSNLFFSEKDLDLRVEMLSALPFVESDDLNLSVPILQEALKPSQPRELRDAALDAIQSLNNPQTLPLLLPLLNDSDEELRETAALTIEYYREVIALEAK